MTKQSPVDPMVHVLVGITKRYTREMPLRDAEAAEKLMVTEREIRHLVKEAHSNGIFICTVGEGYWYSESDQDIKDTIAFKRKPAFSYLKSAWGLRRGLRRKNSPNYQLF